MSQLIESVEHIAERARMIYERDIRAEVEPGHLGEYLVLDVESGAYEIDRDDLAASKRAKEKYPDASLFTIRIGHPTAYRLGGRFRVGQS